MNLQNYDRSVTYYNDLLRREKKQKPLEINTCTLLRNAMSIKTIRE